MQRSLSFQLVARPLAAMVIDQDDVHLLRSILL